MASLKTFRVYVAHYDHTDTITREAMLTIRATDAGHAEEKAMHSREWNFADAGVVHADKKGIGEEMDLSIVGNV